MSELLDEENLEAHLLRPVWLLADSFPKRWRDVLESPLDPRHPTRHSIWTPIFEEVQEQVYLKRGRRIDRKALFISNAAGNDPETGDPCWDWEHPDLLARIQKFGEQLEKAKPFLVLTFGQRAYEFSRRARKLEPRRATKWDVAALADAFSDQIAHVAPGKVNVLPLLHAVVARKGWQHVHAEFSGRRRNYFQYVGTEIADCLITHGDQLQIWYPVPTKPTPTP